MTSQIRDCIVHSGKQLELAASNGEGLFDPRRYGLPPVAFSNACYRGFFVRYVVHKKRLHVGEVRIGLDAKPGDAPALEGTQPEYDQDRGFFVYPSLDIAVSFTGGILAGANHDWYFSEFDHPAWPYRQVYEMLFRNGLLEKTFERSKALGKLRSEFSTGSVAHRSLGEIRSAVDACLTRPYT